MVLSPAPQHSLVGGQARHGAVMVLEEGNRERHLTLTWGPRKGFPEEKRAGHVFGGTVVAKERGAGRHFRRRAGVGEAEE